METELAKAKKAKEFDTRFKRSLLETCYILLQDKPDPTHKQNVTNNVLNLLGDIDATQLEEFKTVFSQTR